MPRLPESDANEPEDFYSRGQETQDWEDLLAGRLPSESEMPAEASSPAESADPLQTFIDSNSRLFDVEAVPKADDAR